jgi:hypothetical protein
MATLRERMLVALGFVAIAKADARVARGQFALQVFDGTAGGWVDVRRYASRRGAEEDLRRLVDAGAGKPHELRIRRTPPSD